jgi:hypothetical protein
MIPVEGDPARSADMMAADPRKNENLDTSILECLTGIRNSSRDFACSSRNSIGSLRVFTGLKMAWLARGTLFRMAFPISIRSCIDGRFAVKVPAISFDLLLAGL